MELLLSATIILSILLGIQAFLAADWYEEFKDIKVRAIYEVNRAETIWEEINKTHKETKELFEETKKRALQIHMDNMAFELRVQEHLDKCNLTLEEARKLLEE